MLYLTDGLIVKVRRVNPVIGQELWLRISKGWYGMIREFRKFIERGNAMDMAIGIIIGAAFTAIVNSMVNDLLMPLISLFSGGVDLSSMKYTLSNGATFNYGSFISAVIQFFLIALIVFLLARSVNRFHEIADQIMDKQPESLKKLIGKDDEDEKKPPVCPACLEEVKEGATRCPHCGEKFDAPMKSESQAVAGPKPEPQV